MWGIIISIALLTYPKSQPYSPPPAYSPLMPTVPCVRVARTAGEATRQELAAAGVLADEYAITSEDDHLYLPVTDPAGVPAEFTIVEHPVPTRETQTMPADLLDVAPTYERIGEVIVIDEADPDRARTIADAIVASDLPVETVLNRASKVAGEFRVRDYEMLTGDSTEAVHREYGHAYAVDLAQVYFSPRLVTERHRVTQQIDADEQVLDMFAGVGPYAIPAADRGARVVAVDKNPTAIEYLRANAARNDVADRITAIAADVRTVTDEYTGWADRLVMNLPHSADAFLPTAMALAGEQARIHYYDIQHEDAPFGPGIAALRAAADAAGYSVTVETEHVVRSYAPHELNVCLDVTVRRNP